jgi:tetratricopeptide (TPR) repeat protein
VTITHNSEISQDTAHADVYAAFISYRQVEPDRTVARRLHRYLETHVIPAIHGAKRRRLGKCFLDDQDMKAGDISQTLRQALLRARALLVICSPETPGSRWVAEEITTFAASRSEPIIVPIIVGGTTETSVPPALLSTAAAADPVDAGSSAKHAVAFRAIIARILGVPEREIEAAERVRRLTLFRRAVAAVALLIGTGVLANAAMRTEAYQRYRVLHDAPMETALLDEKTDAVREWVQALASSHETLRAKTALELAAHRFGGQLDARQSIDADAVSAVAEEAEKLGFHREAESLWTVVDRYANVLDGVKFNSVRVSLAASLARAGRFDEALKQGRRVSAPDSEYRAARLSAVYSMSGRPEEAIAVFEACCAAQAPVLTWQPRVDAALAFVRLRSLSGFRNAVAPLRERSRCPEWCWQEVERFAASGNAEVVRKALLALRSVSDADRLRVTIVRALADGDDYPAAERYAGTIDRLRDRDVALATVAADAARHDDLTAARRNVHGIHSALVGCEAMTAVAEETAKRGKAQAFVSVAEQLPTLCTEAYPLQRIRSLGIVAATALQSGEQATAEAAWRGIIASRGRIDVTLEVPSELLPLAEAQARVGAAEEATLLWQKVWDANPDDAELATLRLSMARGGRLRQALDLRRPLADGTTSGATYEELLQIVRLSTPPSHRAELLAEASGRPPLQRVSMLIALADVVRERDAPAATILAMHALEAAGEVEPESARQSATAGAALRLARLGRPREARLACSADRCTPTARLTVFAAILASWKRRP